jgi:hypothetical protein
LLLLLLAVVAAAGCCFEALVPLEVKVFMICMSELVVVVAVAMIL